jgi:putative transposase
LKGTNDSVVTSRFDWVYDALDRLTSERYDHDVNAEAAAADFWAEYDFDLVGNRLEKRLDKRDAAGVDEVFAYAAVRKSWAIAVGEGLLHHSDRGSQYTSDAYQQTLQGLKITCSMSRSGECNDNAVAERFFWSLKHEWAHHQSYADIEAARLSVFKYIESFYNRERLHQSLGYKSPDQFETEYAPVLAA